MIIDTHDLPVLGQKNVSLARNTGSVDTSCGGDLLIYGAYVTSCCESWIESHHKTKAGAYRAGRQWIINRFNQSHDSRACIGKSALDFMPGLASFKVILICVSK